MQLVGGCFTISITLGFFAWKSLDKGILWFFFLCFLNLCWLIVGAVIGVMIGDYGK